MAHPLSELTVEQQLESTLTVDQEVGEALRAGRRKTYASVRRIVSRSNIVTSVPKADAPRMLSTVSYRDQGDLEMYTAANLKKRDSNRHAPEVVAALDAFWNSLPKLPTGKIDRSIYTWVCRTIYFVLVDSATEEEFRQVVVRDWRKDTAHGNAMDAALFRAAFFKLADLWCETTDASEYGAFITKLQKTVESGVPYEGWLSKQEEREAWRGYRVQTSSTTRPNRGSSAASTPPPRRRSRPRSAEPTNDSAPMPPAAAALRRRKSMMPSISKKGGPTRPLVTDLLTAVRTQSSTNEQDRQSTPPSSSTTATTPTHVHHHRRRPVVKEVVALKTFPALHPLLHTEDLDPCATKGSSTRRVPVSSAGGEVPRPPVPAIQNIEAADGARRLSSSAAAAAAVPPLPLMAAPMALLPRVPSMSRPGKRSLAS